jgi:hypothetical protein
MVATLKEQLAHFTALAAENTEGKAKAEAALAVEQERTEFMQAEVGQLGGLVQVRKTPCRPRSWANSSPF